MVANNRGNGVVLVRPGGELKAGEQWGKERDGVRDTNTHDLLQQTRGGGGGGERRRGNEHK